MTLQELYDKAKAESPDIGEHMARLRWYAAHCQRITEFGVRDGCSTAALIAGAAEGRYTQAQVVSFDLFPFKQADTYAAVARENGVDFSFTQADDCAVDIAPTDMLFIDTVHTYEQLDRELRTHAASVRGFIVMHDTYSVPSVASIENNGKEMWIAILKLLAKGEWRILEDFTNQHGLTVLERNN